MPLISINDKLLLIILPNHSIIPKLIIISSLLTLTLLLINKNSIKIKLISNSNKLIDKSNKKIYKYHFQFNNVLYSSFLSNRPIITICYIPSNKKMKTDNNRFTKSIQSMSIGQIWMRVYNSIEMTNSKNLKVSMSQLLKSNNLQNNIFYSTLSMLSSPIITILNFNNLISIDSNNLMNIDSNNLMNIDSNNLMNRCS